MVGIVQLVFCGLLVMSVKGSSHWVVMEDGKVQEKLESPFAINQPHDLMAFMKQETNYATLQEIKEVLNVDKKQNERNDHEGMESREQHYLSDKDCIAAGHKLIEADLYTSSVLPLEDKEIEVSDFVDFTKPDKGIELQEPNCVKINTNLASMSSKCDNLEGVAYRKHLNRYRAEPEVRSSLKYMENIQELANAIDSALKQNSSSWVAYNLAALYWRMKGKAENAVECVRRAIYFSPHQYRDVALLSLANILHRSRYSVNASVVLEDALRISNTSIIHFALGSIYAIMGRFVRSRQHYEKASEMDPNFSTAKERVHAVKCHHKLQSKLEAQHEILRTTLQRMKAYQAKQEQYIELYKTIAKMQLTRLEQSNRHYFLTRYMMKKEKFCESESKKLGVKVSLSTNVCHN